jgi:glycosyltransferase involved in cell wall biosynthesis
LSWSSNGSQDRTLDVLTEKYSEWIDLIVIEANIGLSGDRNLAFESIQSELVAYLDDDNS